MLDLMFRLDGQIQHDLAARYRCLLVMLMQTAAAHVKSRWLLGGHSSVPAAAVGY